MNYRKFYSEKIGEEVPKDFDIHHLDHDRQNNDFFNLVAIPKKLHRKYHKIYSELEGSGGVQNSLFILPNDNSGLFEWKLSKFIEYNEIRNEIIQYLNIRMHKLIKNGSSL